MPKLTRIDPKTGDHVFPDLSHITIVGAQLEDSGVGWYRIVQPLAVAHRYLGIHNDGLPFEGKAQTLNFTIMSQSLNMKLKDAQVLWTTKVFTPEYLSMVAELKKRHHFEWWMDLDDNLITVNPDSPVYDRYFPYLKYILMAVKMCDVLTVSTERVKELYQEIRTGPIVVSPNFVDESLWGPHRNRKKPVIGFAGAAGHEEDLALLRNVLPRPKSDFYLFGQKYSLPKADRYVPWVDLQNYFRYYPEVGVSIAVAPLRLNNYNRCKSNLRIIEAGIQGIPVVASAVDPYLGLPVRYATTADEWKQHLDELIASPEKRAQEGQILKDHILSFYSAKPFAQQFEKFVISRKDLFDVN